MNIFILSLHTVFMSVHCLEDVSSEGKFIAPGLITEHVSPAQILET
jgi:hypothetical protein